MFSINKPTYTESAICSICGAEIPVTGTNPDKPNDNKSYTEIKITSLATDKDNIKTGDNTNLDLYASMLAMSGLLVAILAVLRKKKTLEHK